MQKSTSGQLTTVSGTTNEEYQLDLLIQAIQRLTISEEQFGDKFCEPDEDGKTNKQRSHVLIKQTNRRKMLSRIVHGVGRGIWFGVKLYLVIAAIGYFISSNLPTQKFILRYSQDIIHPVMRQIRLWSIPIIKSHPFLSEFHEEECLVENPLYGDPSLNCWPCEDTKTIMNLTNAVNYSKAYVDNEKPFVMRDVLSKMVTFESLKQVYEDHSEDLQMGTARAMFNGQSIADLKELMDLDLNISSDFHIMWKMHRVMAARVIRKVFLRPRFVPESSEVSLQKFIHIDGPTSDQYRLPLTDFANVWLVQGQGHRTIVLDPSEECRSNCSALSILLQPMDVLYWNWQFYRARSLPSRTSPEPSISFLASFY
jgi:hypothetical protein